MTKTIIKSVPAFDVVDLGQEVIDLPFGSMGNSIGAPGLRFCVTKETKNHGTLYPEVSPGCSVYYALENGDCPKEAVERTKKFGHEMYWVNNCGSMLTSDKRARWEMVLLKPGQKVLMDGVLLEFYRKGPNSDYYGFKEI